MRRSVVVSIDPSPTKLRAVAPPESQTPAARPVTNRTRVFSRHLHVTLTLRDYASHRRRPMSNGQEDHGHDTTPSTARREPARQGTATPAAGTPQGRESRRTRTRRDCAKEEHA